MTLASRILGMIRDIVSAKSFGTGWQWDAFIYAFMVPNFLRRIVGEGALSSAFIPVYSEIHAREGTTGAFHFTNVIATLLASVLVAAVLVAELVLHLLLKIETLPPTLHLTLNLLQLFFPYLWFISLFSLGMGVLNCHKHFLAPALGSVILDLVWIAAVLWLTSFAGPNLSDQVRWLAMALLVSGAIQLAAELPPLYRAGFRLRWVWDLIHPGLKKTIDLLLPSIMAFAVVQINLLVDSTLAFFIGPGANSSLWYGNRLMQFPLGVFAIAMGTVLLPTIAHQTARKDLEAAKKSLSFALRSVFLIILPSTVGLIVLRIPIVQLLFERGEFDPVSTARTASVLMYYSFGLFAYSGQKIIAAGFYAVQDPRTPVKMGVIALVSNIILNLLLMGPMRESGLALATSLSGAIQFLLLIFLYDRRISNFPLGEIARSFGKIFLASLAMGFVCFLAFGGLQRAVPGRGTIELVVHVFGSISLSMLAFVGFCFLLRVSEMREALGWIIKKVKQAE